MNKLVYLFELDSVRNHDEEIRIGQQALYDEIVFNDNIVVLTYNQLVDSRGFFSLLDIPEYYSSLIKLFEEGAIRISQYGDIRTISQYLLTSFEYEKEFIYSGWPLKFTQRRLISLIRRSLMYSDLSEMFGYIGDKQTARIRSDEEIKDLFIEVDKQGNITESALSTDQLREILINLYWLIKTVLRLSAIHTIYIPPRDPNEYSQLKFHNILNHVVNFNINDEDTLWKTAIEIIQTLPAYKHKCDDRSPYVRELLNNYYNNNRINQQEHQYAEAIINLVYNYTCEISICNISKHYNVEELIDNNPNSHSMPTFVADFISRLHYYWDIGYHSERFLQEECNQFIEYEDPRLEKKPNEAVRILEYVKNRNIDNRPIFTSNSKSNYSVSSTLDSLAEKDLSISGINRYEYKLQEQQKNRHKKISSSIAKKLFFTILCIAIACGIEIVIEILQNYIADSTGVSTFLWISLETIFFLSIVEFITNWLSTFTPIQSLSEAIGNVDNLVRDWLLISKRKLNLYHNPLTLATDLVEPISTEKTIDYVQSSALKKYFKLKERAKANTDIAELFSPSTEIPLINDSCLHDDSSYLKKMIRCEEMHNYNFGVIYESQYNRLIVDPIISSKGSKKPFYPYERVVPSDGTGVVMVTMHNDKFVLLRQFRHAPRKEQYCFPRGYGEKNISPQQNAVKELCEEIGATISEQPVFIGNISPDSGLTSSCVSVYYIEIDSFSMKEKNEGILDIIEVTEEEFETMINHRNGNNKNVYFDDGFTLAAYTLYKRSVL